MIWAPQLELAGFITCDGFFCLGAKLRSAEAWRAEGSATAPDGASIFPGPLSALNAEELLRKQPSRRDRQPATRGSLNAGAA